MPPDSQALPTVPDIEVHRESFDIVGYPVEPGDVVAFNYHVLHPPAPALIPMPSVAPSLSCLPMSRSAFRSRPNVVPGLLEHAGRTWQEGQMLANFEDLFPVA